MTHPFPLPFALALLALLASPAEAKHGYPHKHERPHPVIRNIAPDVLASVPDPSMRTQDIPLPRPRPFAAIWNDRVTSVVGGW